MYLMNKDTYICDFCGVELAWGENDTPHGNMWGCERCEKNFCERCFIKAHGSISFQRMLQEGLAGSVETEKLLCPDCYAKLNKPLMQRLLDAGYPKEKMDHNESDLYVYVTPLTTKIISEWCEENGYRMSWHCPTFKDQITGRQMYDCAFQYYEDDEKTVSVMCKDCKFYTEKARRCDHPKLEYDVECYDHWITTMPNDYCSYGETRNRKDVK